MYKLLFASILITSVNYLFGQSAFKYKTAVQKVDSTAFYRIGLSPELLAKCDPDLSDLRLVDRSGKQVSFLYGNQLPVKNESNFVAFPFVDVKQADSLTTLIVQNNLNLSINQLSIHLRNTSAERLFTLSGSDDLSRWYAIKENVLLSGAADNTNKSIYEQAINFPASSYRYFKLSVDNKRKEPISIVEVGNYQRQYMKPAYTELNGTTFHQKDTIKLSKVVVRLKDVYPVNKIRLTITGSKYYKRSMSIYAIIGKQRILIGDTLLSSSGFNDFLVNTKARVIEVQIANEDNPPLSVKAIQAFSLNQSIIGYLNKEQSYDLLFGDSLAKAPDYDLKFFADSVRRDLVLLKVGNVSANPLYNHQAKKKDAYFPAWSIWLAIALVLAILGLLTYRMVKEIDKKKSAA